MLGAVKESIIVGTDMDFELLTAMFNPETEPTDVLIATIAGLRVSNSKEVQHEMADYALTMVINSKEDGETDVADRLDRMLNALVNACTFIKDKDLASWIGTLRKFFCAKGDAGEEDVPAALEALQIVTSMTKDVKLFRKVANSIQGLKRIAYLNEKERHKTRLERIWTRLMDELDCI